MQFVNDSIMTASVQNTTGSMVISLLLVIIVILAISIMLGIAVEFTAVIVFPLLLGCMSYYGEFLAIGFVALIYIAILVTKNFIIK